MKKKLIAILLALTFILTPAMMASAEDITATGTSLSGDGSGFGVIPEFIEADIFIVELPTSRSFDFILDPQGIYGMTKEEVEAMQAVEVITGSYLLSEDGTNPLDDAGQIVFRGNAAPYIMNHGNLDTDVSIVFEFDAAGQPITTEATRANVNNKGNSVADNKDTDVFIGATFSEDPIIATMTSFEAPEYFTGNQTLAITTTETTSLLVIPAAEYEDDITVDSAVVDETTGITVELNAAYVGSSKGTQFLLAGECNPLANWSTVDTEALGITIEYSIEKAGTTTPGGANTNAAYVYAGTPAVTYISGGTDGYEYTNEPIESGPVYKLLGGAAGVNPLTAIGPSIANVAWRIDDTSGLPASALESVTVGDTALTATTHYTVSIAADGNIMIRFSGTNIGWYAAAKAQSQQIKVVISGTSYTFPVTLN